MSDRQSSLDQTLTSVISLLENEQTLKKVCSCSLLNLFRRIVFCRAEVSKEEKEGKGGKKQEATIEDQEPRETWTDDRQSRRHLNLLMISPEELLGN